MSDSTPGRYKQTKANIAAVSYKQWSMNETRKIEAYMGQKEFAHSWDDIVPRVQLQRARDWA